jgi:DUF4097 and DUF4098 domain-containing protein YvlB
MSGKKIGFLLLLLGFGASIETAWSVRHHVGFGPSGWRIIGGRFYGNSFTFDAEATRPLAPGRTAEIQNAFGAVKVGVGEPGEARVKLRKVVYRSTEEQAATFAGRIELRVEDTPDGLRITTNREELQHERDDVGFETNLEVTLPRGTKVVAKNEHGAMEVREVAEAQLESSFDTATVENVAGAVDLQSRHGDVVVTRVGGSLRLNVRHGAARVEGVVGETSIDLQHGDLDVRDTTGLAVKQAFGSLTVRNVRGNLGATVEHGATDVDVVTGNVEISTSFDHLNVKHVSGDAHVKTEHGALDASDIGAALKAEATFDHVRLERVGGPAEITVTHGGVQATSLRKGAIVRAFGDTVRIDDFLGPIDVQARRGDVELRPIAAIVEAVSVTTDEGAIRVEVPAGSRFALEASAVRGEVEVEVPGLSTTRGDDGRLTGELGGGATRVVLHARHGDVSVSGRSVRASQ